MIEAATRARGQYWIVSQVDSGSGRCKVKRTATSPESRWLPYNPDLTLSPGDKVRLVGANINTAVVAHKT